MEPFTLAEYRRLMMGEGRGRPRGIFADQESWVTREARQALEALDEKQGVTYDVTWVRGRPIFTRREK